MKKLIYLIFPILVACDEAKVSYIDNVTAHLNNAIDHSQSGKMILFNEHFSNGGKAQIFIKVRYNKISDNSKEEIALLKIFEFNQKQQFCKSPEAKRFFNTGIRFFARIVDKNNKELAKYRIDSSICSELQIESISEKQAISQYKKILKDGCYSMSEINNLVKQLHISKEDYCECMSEKAVNLADKKFIIRSISADLSLPISEVKKTTENLVLKAFRYCTDTLRKD
ncbi:hypothetical protein ACLSY8_06320 [Avibacterium avium]|uniref:hypothetical protein n=1 Tax=Avibacterium avium TaxID=751 RepID=UPI003BF8E5D8